MTTFTSKSRKDLVNQALTNIGILAAGQTASAEDFDACDDNVDALVQRLEMQQILSLDDINEIPLEVFNQLAVLLADDCAFKFGLPGVPSSPSSPNPVQNATDAIRLVEYSRPTYERAKTEYF